MRSSTRSTSAVALVRIAALLVCSCSVFPVLAKAQGTQGQNAVCSSSSSCSTSSNTVGTNAFIDASIFGNNRTDICTILNNILSSTIIKYPSTGAVIDARGLPGNTGTNMTCATSPWGSGSGYLNVPSVILLPAGTITTSVPWVVPGNTKLVGTATGPGTNNLLDTTLQASSSFASPAIVQFGDSHCPSSGCQGISLEHLSINGGVSGNVFNGIENDNCGLLCYVDHVNMYQVLGTGLNVSGTNASDSGPYSNITFDVGSSTSSSTHCAHIEGTNGTRGIHGMTCIASPDATSAILLDASNNSIEDVRIIGFYNGIVVGSGATAKSNVLLNIYGDTLQSGAQPIYLIQIYSGTVSDLAIMAVSNAGGTGTTTIQDLQTATTLTDPYVGMYALGESNSGGNSRFTTSTSTAINNATWMFGSGNPQHTCPTGSLYSDASGGGLWVCVGGVWQGVPTN
jgi:hypothetical protein